ncbi:aldo/keto reductase [Catalinimonas niigatensis]|uniref:aldo/keto reductase n=1 Tax=Catalinimonas niigatensis TaxID=1397264 RepID=UPI002666E365|nr:aldo/keto reductase [Catalinimonas niigatensis]WPP50120.1 aldo/keto reductase [Catalinimonas niigatensis]
MQYRAFGNTDLQVSEVGFGAWGIGGPAMAGDIPIGWGDVKDDTSIKALQKAFDLGINFYDTADFYGLGHSEELIGQVFGSHQDIIVATKVGHRLANDQSIVVDYSKEYILKACEDSLHRLRRDTIDYYQLHTAKKADLERGECLEALEQLKKEGKIRYWGVSLNTYTPEIEANYMLDHQLGNGFQLVFNMINQQALGIVEKAQQAGMGIIARMPLQFGLLTGKFTKGSRFDTNDHRHFRLTPEVLATSLDALEEVWPLTEKYGISKTELSMSFILSFEAVSTVIPGIKTSEQAEKNTQGTLKLAKEDRDFIVSLFESKFKTILQYMQKHG